MNTRSHLLRFTFLGFLCLAIVAAFAVTILFKPQPIVQAASVPDQTIMEPLSPDGTGYRSCNITDVYVDATIVLVICSTDSPIGSGLNRYGIKGDFANKILADRLLVLLNTAYALNVSIDLSYDENSAQNPPGCSSINCRLLKSVSLEH